MNSNPIEDAWKHYISSNEMIRILRTNPSVLFDINKLKIEPYDLNYSKNLNVGVVIGTYGSIPYIDLSLFYLKKINNIDNILIVDDCSAERDKLLTIIREYGADFLSTPYKLPYIRNVGSNGDTAAFLYGLKWAKSKNIDILIKLSRRLIPCYRWIDDFKQLVLDIPCATYSSYCIKDKFNFRTECVGMNVNIWNNLFVIEQLTWLLDNNFLIFAEYYFHEIAKYLSYNNINEKYVNYAKTKNYFYSGYVDWKDLLGTNRYSNENRHSNVLWYTYTSPEQYCEKTKIFTTKYKPTDFKLFR